VSASAMQSFRGIRAVLIRGALGVYKHAVSPALHAITRAQGACRFQPTCSEYAAIAIAEHGTMRGGLMALMRLMRCHPLHPGGFDPVPAKHCTSHAEYSGPAIS